MKLKFRSLGKMFLLLGAFIEDKINMKLVNIVVPQDQKTQGTSSERSPIYLTVLGDS